MKLKKKNFLFSLMFNYGSQRSGKVNDAFKHFLMFTRSDIRKSEILTWVSRTSTEMKFECFLWGKT